MNRYAFFLTSLLVFVWVGAFGGAEAFQIHAVYRPEGVPVVPNAQVWREAPEQDIMLMRQMIAPPTGGGTIPVVKVRAMHDGQSLAFRFVWTDVSADDHVGVDRFRDAIAIGFPVRGAEVLPSPFMGDADNPINIWQWTADFDANARGHGGFAANYPHTEGVWYFPQDYEVTREVLAWRGTEPVMELVSRGWGTVERKVSQNVQGISEYADGRWQVVLRRRLATGNPEDTHFRPGEQTYAIIAIWNGVEREVNGKKSVTMAWIPLILEPTIKVSDQ